MEHKADVYCLNKVSIYVAGKLQLYANNSY